MYDFFVYDGKNSAEPDDRKFGNLQKFTHVVAKLCDDLPDHKNYKVFFDNWFTTPDLLHHFRSKEIHVVGTTRLNLLRVCPLDTNKDLLKSGTGAMDYRCNSNFGIIYVKWVDITVVNLASNFVEVEPNEELERWWEKEKVKKNIPCPHIVRQYNKSMGGVDLADMLLSLYQTPCKAKLWYLKILWHLIDVAKISAWILYRHHLHQNGKPHEGQKAPIQSWAIRCYNSRQQSEYI